MFGEHLDYRLLRPLTHGRNLAPAEELTLGAQPYGADEATGYLDKARSLYFGGELPVSKELRYLDIGCGTGQLAVGLSLAGAHRVTGIDLVGRNIAHARSNAGRLLVADRPGFEAVSAHDFASRGERYNVVIALAALEHVDRPAQFLREIRALLTRNGRAYVSMTPFHGPLGDHMWGFFRVQIPWRGVIFSEKAILRLRQERFRPDEPCRRYQEVSGGLNLMTIGQYLRYVEAAGLRGHHRFDPHFSHYAWLWPFLPFSWCISKVPKVRDYCTFNIYSILHR